MDSSSSPKKGKKILFAIANGSEEIESVVPIDIFVRARLDVTLVSIETTKTIVAARNTKITADKLISECVNETFDCILCPGGPGAKRLSESKALISMLKIQKESGRLYGAICAAPAVVFEPWGLLGSKATCYPSHQKTIAASKECTLVPDSPVVISGNCITSQGPATAMAWALEIVGILVNEETKKSIAKGLLFTL